MTNGGVGGTGQNIARPKSVSTETTRDKTVNRTKDENESSARYVDASTHFGNTRFKSLQNPNLTAHRRRFASETFAHSRIELSIPKFNCGNPEFPR